MQVSIFFSGTCRYLLMELFHSQDEMQQALQAALRNVACSKVYAAEKKKTENILKKKN